VTLAKVDITLATKDTRRRIYWTGVSIEIALFLIGLDALDEREALAPSAQLAPQSRLFGKLVETSAHTADSPPPVGPLVRSRTPKRPKLSEMEVSTSQFQCPDRILANDRRFIRA
jgi:hypothetical protein